MWHTSWSYLCQKTRSLAHCSLGFFSLQGDVDLRTGAPPPKNGHPEIVVFTVNLYMSHTPISLPGVYEICFKCFAQWELSVSVLATCTLCKANAFRIVPDITSRLFLSDQLVSVLMQMIMFLGHAVFLCHGLPEAFICIRTGLRRLVEVHAAHQLVVPVPEDLVARPLLSWLLQPPG